MSRALRNLLALLNPERTEEGLFRGQNEDLGLRQVSGGQVVDQALYAAKETIPDGRLVHSFHSYFLHPSDSKKPVTYDAETLRDGNSFSAHRVSAIQNGEPILYMAASFQAPGADFEHRKAMSSAPAPNGLPSKTQTAQSLAHLLPPMPKDKLISDRPLEIHPVEFHSPLKGHVTEPHHQVWIHTSGSMPDGLCVHQYLLGHASDLNFLPVALQPCNIGFLEPGIQIATTDHFMWFHRPLNLNGWLLYSVENTSASSTHGFVRGEFCTQDGVLVASTVREGVMRNHN